MAYTQAQFENTMRLVLEPAHFAGQLPIGASPIITPIAVADTPYKIVGAADIDVVVLDEFTYDAGTTDFTFNRAGATGVWFCVNITTSFSQVAAASEITMKLTKNGTEVDGIFFIKTIGTSGDVMDATLKGHVQLDHGDYLNITVQGSKSGDFEGWGFSTDIEEEEL